MRIYPPTSTVALRERRANCPAARPREAVPARNTRQPSVDVDAEPLSSDDESNQHSISDEEPAPTPQSKRILQGFEKTDQQIRQQQDRAKRGKSQSQTGVKKGRSSRGKALIKDNPDELSLHLQDTSARDDNISEDEARMSSWMDRPNKKRKVLPSKTYRGSSSINVHASAQPSSQTFFQTVPDFPSSASQKDSSKLKDQQESFVVPAEIPDVASTKLSKLPGSTASSDSTLDNAFSVFSHPDSRDLFQSPSHHRSGSDSSLSSIQSISASEFAEFEKDHMMSGSKDEQKKKAVTPSTAPCPLCGWSVPYVDLEDFCARHNLPSTGTYIPNRLQRKFCQDHKTREAREAYVERGYPIIDWEELASTKTSRHLPAMRAILSGRERSEYRDKLAEASSSTRTIKGKTFSGINNLLLYLKDEVMDVVKYGYYGPRGGQIAAETLMVQLSKELALAAEKDSLVRDATAVGFVQGVLVPELISKWVAEDLRAKSDGQQTTGRGRRSGRTVGAKVEYGVNGDEDENAQVARILEESSEIGRLLNEDEDDL